MNASDLEETTIQRKVKRKDRNKKKKDENAEDRGGMENVDIDKKNMRTGKDNAEEERSQTSEKENSIRSKRLVEKASPFKLKHVYENTDNTSL